MGSYTRKCYNFLQRPTGVYENLSSCVVLISPQVQYTFPVGLTSLWWYAPASNLDDNLEAEIDDGDDDDDF
jgi:hypothetical protein